MRLVALSGQDQTVKGAVAALLGVLPPIVAVVFVKATSSPRDANVGGALYLTLGIVVGVTLAALYLVRSRRRP